MRILLLQNGQPPCYSTARGYPQVMALHLDYQFRAMGHEVVYGNVATVQLDAARSCGFYLQPGLYPQADAALCCEQRGFFNRSCNGADYFYTAVMHAVDGKIGTLCDNNEHLGPEDVTFYHVPAPEKPGSKYIGWAADAEMLRPRLQSGEMPRAIYLIDHPYQGQSGATDITGDLYRQALREIRPSCVLGLPSDYPWSIVTEYYRRAVAFFPTHGESCGWSVIEAAMAGALIVAKDGFIKPALLADLPHLIYKGDEPPWDSVHDVISQSDKFSRHELVAAKFDRWRRMAELIIEGLR